MAKGYIYSKANHIVKVQYGDECILIPAFARKYVVADVDKLGTISDPRITVIKLEEVR